MNNIIKRLALSPKTLFLIDSIGALVTGFFLFAILGTFNEYFGAPLAALTFLSLLAVMFFFYSISCFLFVKSNWHFFIRVISIANLLYCCLTLVLVIYYFQSLTLLGIVYFLAEIVVICALVFVELKVLNRWTKKLDVT